jgi:predicted ATP-grasp superfamily ATP-dependent carboligase
MRKYTSRIILLVIVLLRFTVAGLAETPKKGKLLMMTLTTGFRHSTVELSAETIKKSAEVRALRKTVTQDVASFTQENLKNYDAVVFNTTGELPLPMIRKRTSWISSGAAKDSWACTVPPTRFTCGRSLVN